MKRIETTDTPKDDRKRDKAGWKAQLRTARRQKEIKRATEGAVTRVGKGWR